MLRTMLVLRVRLLVWLLQNVKGIDKYFKMVSLVL